MFITLRQLEQSYAKKITHLIISLHIFMVKMSFFHSLVFVFKIQKHQQIMPTKYGNFSIYPFDIVIYD